MTITKDMMVDDLIHMDPMMTPILMRLGMHCIGCASSAGETLAEAALVHGMDPDELTAQLNDFFGAPAEEDEEY